MADNEDLKPKRRRLGHYAKLSAGYYRDDAIMEAGEAAELLFVRSLAFCSETPSDGYITQRQVELIIGAGLRNLTARIDKLCEATVWEKADGGYIVRAWLKWNPSVEDAGMVRKLDRERKRNKTGLRSVSDEIPAGTGTES